MSLTFPSIAEMLRLSRFHISTISSANTLRKMRLHFEEQVEGGLTYAYAIIEEETRGRGRRSTPHGIVFLNPGSASNTFTGIHYTPSDCGGDRPSVRKTADMLSDHFGISMGEVLGVLTVYSRIIVVKTKNGATIEPA